MLDEPPQEREWSSWLYVALWSLIIFCTVPVARAIQAFVADHLGREAFFYTVAAAIIVAAAAALVSLRRKRLPLGAYVWLFGVATGFIAYAYSLRENPEEALHFVEYGCLGLLVYRAFVHRIRDYSIYFAGTLVVGLVGMTDEWIQWITPGRVWDLRDVQINLVAGGLTQVGIAAGLRPAIVFRWPPPASLRRLCYLVALGLFMLGLNYLNTPERVAWYTERVPFLSFLLESENTMVEYGYRYRDPKIGIFRSRFTREDLEKNDRQRGLDIAQILDRYTSRESFAHFRKTYTVHSDPYVHEAGIHLFRRNRHLERASLEETNEAKRREFYNIALRENQILDKYFPTALRNSKHRWTPGLQRRVEGNALTQPQYESRVSKELITQIGERQVVWGLVLAIGGVLLLGGYLGRGG